jgi:hypothetical protein
MRTLYLNIFQILITVYYLLNSLNEFKDVQVCMVAFTVYILEFLNFGSLQF